MPHAGTLTTTHQNNCDATNNILHNLFGLLDVIIAVLYMHISYVPSIVFIMIDSIVTRLTVVIRDLVSYNIVLYLEMNFECFISVMININIE